jgi:hypothetical protein
VRGLDGGHERRHSHPSSERVHLDTRKSHQRRVSRQNEQEAGGMAIPRARRHRACAAAPWAPAASCPARTGRSSSGARGCPSRPWGWSEEEEQDAGARVRVSVPELPRHGWDGEDRRARVGTREATRADCWVREQNGFRPATSFKTRFVSWLAQELTS